MGAWWLALQLDGAGSLPLYLQITAAIIAAVRAGRLRPGERLPGSRALAKSLSIHRNTVVAAYRELSLQGWIEAVVGSGTRVSRRLPETSLRPAIGGRHPESSVAGHCGYELPPPGIEAKPAERWSRSADRLSLSTGVPDLSQVPVDELARAYRRALRRNGTRLLDYADPQGYLPLRQAIAAMLRARRGLNAEAAEIVITRGSQMAMWLVARLLTVAGDRVGVEALGYPPAWRVWRSLGARLSPLPMDGEGLLIDRLERLLQRRPLRALYVTPHHHYPTLAVLPPRRRMQLLQLAERHRLAIIEDDYDHEFHYRGRPIMPLASADRSGLVVYLGSLSKTLAPSLRLGYVVAPRPLIERLVELRALVDRQGDTVLEAAVTELIEEGVLQAHVRRMHRIYAERQRVLAALLRRHFGSLLEFEVPAGGMALWVRAPGIDVDAWATRAAAAGVEIATARHFAVDGKSRPFVRLGFASHSAERLAVAVRVLRRTLPSR